MIFLIFLHCHWFVQSYPINNFSFTAYESFTESANEQSIQNRNQLTRVEDTKKRKNVITHFFANNLVRRKVNWKGKEAYELILEGSAVIKHDNTIIEATRIQLDPEDNGILEGRIQVSDPKEGIFMFAQRGFYNRKEEKVIIEGNPYINLKKNSQNILITAQKIERDISAGTIYIGDKVKMHSEQWNIFADYGIYTDKEKEFLLHKQPIFLGKNIYMTSKYIKYNSETKKIIIDKEPLLIHFINYDTKKDEKQDQLPRKKEKMVITADRIEYRLQQNNKKYNLEELSKIYNLSPLKIKEFLKNQNLIQEEPFEKIRAKIIGNVLMTSETKYIEGEEFYLVGEDHSALISHKKVKLQDKKEKIELESHYMYYDLKNRYLYLKNQPRLIRYDDNQNIIEELVSEFIERDFAKEYLVAKGNVVFKRKEEIANCEFARLYEKQEKTELYGNVILKRKKDEFNGKRIILTEDKIEIDNEFKMNVYE